MVEFKRVRRTILFGSYELVTVHIAAVRIALPIKVTLTDAKYKFK